MPEPNTASRLLRGRRILVVEDDYITAEDLAMELASLGAEVIGPVPDLAGAFELLAADPPPHAAILDINLGGEMVFPLADRLRDRAIPFVLATGYEEWAIPEPYVRMPRFEKPLNIRQVASALAE
ncbi:response regulator [Rubellimicrobium arenae]|uniref:response regulator n=1 Tax=Rubellimicrobium arenae TaxID=2817372 RepID=UPI001B312D0A|nr:response regulator [Rubellimicrobium arenae]